MKGHEFDAVQMIANAIFQGNAVHAGKNLADGKCQIGPFFKYSLSVVANRGLAMQRSAHLSR
jgi:hypothetical protein